MVRALHESLVVRLALALTALVASLSTMSCVLVTPPQYDPDAGANPPPYIVWDSADPPFETIGKYNDLDVQTFRVTVGDVDTTQELEVRLCLRENTLPETPYLFIQKVKVDPTPDLLADRKPVVMEDVPICNRWGNTGSTVHYLYVKVTDGTFSFDNLGCDVTEGSGSATGAWRFTCDKPK